MNDDPRYPIGEFDLSASLADSERRDRIETISTLPEALREAVNGLDDRQLDEPYREGGWSVRQVVHHLADSHINSYCRFKLALTEDRPTIRAYFEDRWAELPDSNSDVVSSLEIIDGLHRRWTALLNSMSDAEFERELEHPESGTWSLDSMLALYDWHSRHHTAHITSLRARNGW